MTVVSLAVASSFLINSKRNEQCDSSFIIVVTQNRRSAGFVCILGTDCLCLHLERRFLQLWQSEWNTVLLRT